VGVAALLPVENALNGVVFRRFGEPKAADITGLARVSPERTGPGKIVSDMGEVIGMSE
jgi:hypothetical protein